MLLKFLRENEKIIIMVKIVAMSRGASINEKRNNQYLHKSGQTHIATYTGEKSKI